MHASCNPLWVVASKSASSRRRRRRHCSLSTPLRRRPSLFGRQTSLCNLSSSSSSADDKPTFVMHLASTNNDCQTRICLGGHITTPWTVPTRRVCRFLAGSKTCFPAWAALSRWKDCIRLVCRQPQQSVSSSSSLSEPALRTIVDACRTNARQWLDMIFAQQQHIRS